ncbi:MAG: SDR family NAD(P)-dependent oxidoreductase, partial [Brumimicrobium sp.]|nr:SDR family NAD(P)-dependent oxidoreductase [Brumimicrobium sp.]
CCVQLCQTAVDKFGGIDLLINNAAVTARGTLEESNPDIFDKLMTVNVLGSLYPTKAALDELKKAKGGVLFISSLAGIISLPGYSAYCSTKKTLISIAESLKVEMTEHNVFVGIYMAGFTKNDARKTILNPDGTPQPIPERKDVKVNSQEKTVNKIVSQLKRKKFMGFTSFQGRLIYVAYRFFPGLILFILKKNRKKIMPLD